MKNEEHRHGSLDPKMQADLTRRLRRVEGQVRGVQRMVDENRYCPEVLVQISAISEALRKVSEAMLRSHLSHCVTRAVTSGDEDSAEAIYDELADLFSKYAR